MKQSRFTHRPPWWPENEPWPPQHGHFPRNAFFRRMGCLFALFNLLILVVFIAVVGLIANAFGWIESPMVPFAGWFR